MAQTALLVSEQRFKQWTQVDANLRVEDITPFIIQAQDLYIQDTLGTLFFTHIKDQIIASTLTNDEKTLLNDYIGPCLMQYALYLMMPSIKYKIVDKGLVSGTSEETASTSLEELKYLRENTLDTAQFYNKRLTEYLCDNPGMFNLYENPGTKGMYPNKQNPYSAGLVIPQRRGNGMYKYCNCDDGCEDCRYTNLN
jgi:hypothetical protein